MLLEYIFNIKIVYSPYFTLDPHLFTKCKCIWIKKIYCEQGHNEFEEITITHSDSHSSP